MSYGKITESSVNSCNVSYKDEINAETLVGILSGRIDPVEWQAHLDTFFNELPESYISGVMEENGLTLNQLVNIFENLPSAFQGKHFKEMISRA